MIFLSSWVCFLVLDRNTFTHNYRHVVLVRLDIVSFLKQGIITEIICSLLL